MEKSKHEGGHRDRAAESRHRLLLAGMAQFAEKGYDGASVRGIVGSVGCSVPAISSYFGGKEGLAKPRLFRETNVDFMVDKWIRDLRFTAA